MSKPSLSVILITKNEEFHVGNAIDNVKDIAEEIFVVDSGSTDKTVEIAVSKGAKVLFHAFEGFGKQWNWALDNCPIKTVWTMKMDPDERLTERLKAELAVALRQEVASAFAFDRVLWFMGKRLSHMRNRVLRIWKTGQCRFTDVAVNEHPKVVGKCAVLSGEMDHYDSQNLHHWVMKQNHYSSLEAQRIFEGGQLAAQPKLMGDALQRRMWVKRLFFNLPGRYLLLFLYYYFGKLLFIDGRAGYYFTYLRIWTWKMREAKVCEMRNRQASMAVTSESPTSSISARTKNAP